MKKVHVWSVTVGLVVGTILTVCGCKKETPPGQPEGGRGGTGIKSAEKTSFAEVTSKLDPGGNLYAYLSTEQWLSGVSQKVGAWRGLIEAIPNIKDDDREKLGKALDLVTNLIQQSGIEDVSGVGMSSIATEPNFYHSKFYLHHYAGKGSGFLWNMFGQKPHALTGLDLLPTTTALATFSDLDAPLLWSSIKKQVKDAGIPQAEEVLEKLPAAFEKATGLEWDRVLASLGGEFGFAVMLDDAKVIPLPTGGDGDPLQIPEPGLLLVAKVKDDTVFKRIDEALQQNAGQQIVKVDKDGVKMRTWPLPLPLPIQLRPTLATANGYLFIATTDDLINEILAVKAGQKPGLKSTDEFKHLAKDIPTQGNSFSFISQRFGQTIVKIQQQALQKHTGGSGPQMEWIQSMLGSSKPAVTYTVSANTDEGWLAVANGNQHPAKFLAVAAVIPAGVLAGIAVPNFVKARATAQKNACINNLRQIDGAKQQWALENKKSANDTPTADDLKQYLPKKRMLTCPAGGTYTINRVSDPPECSHEGHELPK